MIRLVLDGASIAAYCRHDDLRGMFVAELLAEVTDERGALVGLPVVSLISAYQDLTKPNQFRAWRELAGEWNDVPTEVLPSVHNRTQADELAGDVAAVELMARYTVTLGNPELGQVVHFARVYRAQILTGQPELLRAHFGELYGILPLDG